MNTLILQFKKITPLFFILFAFGYVALLPETQAVEPMAPDTALAGGNTADGHLALAGLTTGIYNSAFGIYAVLTLSTASFDTGLGAGALFSDSIGENTAVGAGALFSNTTSPENTAVGTFALFVNGSGGGASTAVGFDALELNVSAVTNAALGTFAALNNDSDGSGTAEFNTAVGGFALRDNVDGARNTAVGAGAIETGSGGNDNTAVGELAGNGITGSSNCVLGSGSGQGITSASGDTIIGENAGGNPLVLNDCIYIGQNVGSGFSVLESNTIRIGDNLPTTAGASQCFIGGILSNQITIGPGTPVVTIDTTTGQLGWGGDFTAAKVAEQQKKIEQQQASIAELKSTIAQQQKGMEVLTAQLKEQAAQIQKVSAQLEVSKTAPQVVANKP
jgi:hypothetical protein